VLEQAPDCRSGTQRSTKIKEAGQQKIVRVGIEEQVADFGRELRIHITTARHQKKSDPHERQNKDFPAARKI
jgi:hypothetical protein